MTSKMTSPGRSSLSSPRVSTIQVPQEPEEEGRCTQAAHTGVGAKAEPPDGHVVEVECLDRGVEMGEPLLGIDEPDR